MISDLNLNDNLSLVHIDWISVDDIFFGQHPQYTIPYNNNSSISKDINVNNICQLRILSIYSDVYRVEVPPLSIYKINGGNKWGVIYIVKTIGKGQFVIDYVPIKDHLTQCIVR